MKKTYLTPAVWQHDILPMAALATSGVTSEKGIDYGGVDEEGKKDPASRRRRRDVWDDEEEEEGF